MKSESIDKSFKNSKNEISQKSVRHAVRIALTHADRHANITMQTATFRQRMRVKTQVGS
jgi:hypothetical protein